MNALQNAPQARQVVLAEVQPLYADGLRTFIQAEGDMKISRTARKLAQLKQALAGETPNLLLLGEGLTKQPADLPALVRQLREEQPELPIGVLLEQTEGPLLVSLIKAGVTAVVDKDAPRSELLRACRTALRGERYFGNSQQQLLFELVNTNRASAGCEAARESCLTAREVDVLHLLAEGLTSNEIATRLQLSPRTVDTHRKNMLKKTGASNAAGLMKYGLQTGIL